MDSGPIATKRQLLEQLLEQGMVLVALDARSEGVDIPAHLGTDPQLRLNLSYRFGLPMEVEEWGVLATLTFSGSQYDCKIPWEAIFLMVSHVTGQPYLFPEDVPSELLATDAAGSPEQPRTLKAGERCAHSQADGENASAPGEGAARFRRPRLTLVAAAREEARAKGNGSAEESSNGTDGSRSDEPDPPSDSPPRRRGHLRVVK